MASTGNAFSFLTTIARPATWTRSFSATRIPARYRVPGWARWLSALSNQKADTRVRTSPFPGIGVGITTSNADRRSVVTISSLSSPTA